MLNRVGWLDLGKKVLAFSSYFFTILCFNILGTEFASAETVTLKVGHKIVLPTDQGEKVIQCIDSSSPSLPPLSRCRIQRRSEFYASYNVYIGDDLQDIFPKYEEAMKLVEDLKAASYCL